MTAIPTIIAGSLIAAVTAKIIEGNAFWRWFYDYAFPSNITEYAVAKQPLVKIEERFGALTLFIFTPHNFLFLYDPRNDSPRLVNIPQG